MPQRGNDNIHSGSRVEIKDLFSLRDFQKATYRKCALIYENPCVSYQAKFLLYTYTHTHGHIQLVVNSILNNAVVTG